MHQEMAVVTGLCAHGLALARSLARAGVRVVALESDRTLPGLRTRWAETRLVSDINGPGLIDALMRLNLPGRPVLFLTNDRQVETVGSAFSELADAYRLSWAEASDRLLPLLTKEGTHVRCLEKGLRYPRSRMIRTCEDLSGLEFPVLIKPNAPLSAYKVLVAEGPEDLEGMRHIIETSLPAVAQEFIPGDDSAIRFAALYLDRGKVLARFEGRKLRSRPMGHTTVAIAERSDDVHELALEYFVGLDLSGPVSLEVKDDDRGSWIIEPTVGRTDFWVELCIRDGVDFPLIEFRHAARGRIAATQRNTSVWINEERDPAGLLWLAVKSPALLLRRFSACYFSLKDPAPFVAWAARFLAGIAIRLWRKLRRFASRLPTTSLLGSAFLVGAAAPAIAPYAPKAASEGRLLHEFELPLMPPSSAVACAVSSRGRSRSRNEASRHTARSARSAHRVHRRYRRSVAALLVAGLLLELAFWARAIGPLRTRRASNHLRLGYRRELLSPACSCASRSGH